MMDISKITPYSKNAKEHTKKQIQQVADLAEVKANFAAKLPYLIKKDKKGCWLWGGSKNTNGYGSISIGKRGFAKSYLVHRLSYILHKGKIPFGFYVCHTCDTRDCVNPEHLWVGTAKDNAKDCFVKNRTPFGEKQHLAKLNNEEVLKIRELYKKDNLFYRELSVMFNISVPTVCQIIRRKTWMRV
jgi:hypothetical protein